jgi:hypothetical protein
MNERRSAPRKALRVPVVVGAPGLPPLTGRTLDVSLDGLCCTLPASVPAQASCQLMFMLPLPDGPQRLQLQARVAYSLLTADGFKVGLQFSGPDEAALAALRRFSFR